MTKFKIGDKVRANSNFYGRTKLENEWEGTVILVRNNGEFDAETVRSKDEIDVSKSEIYRELEPQYFELIEEKASNNPHIATLERQIAELQEKVATLESAQANKEFVPVTSDNIAIGDKIRVIYAEGIWPATLTNGKVYEVVWRDNEGDFYVTDDDGDRMSIINSEFHAVEKLVSE